LYAAGVIFMRIFQKWGEKQAAAAMAAGGGVSMQVSDSSVASPVADEAAYTPPEMQATGTALDV
jgi:hypothetical protein